jgi:hypothetical protein
VAISYCLGGSPTVTVLDPELIRLPESDLPHVYEDDVLCLHLAGEWTADMLIATTTVPWASEWLLHYEIWLSTDGTWCGGGEH